MSSLCVAVVVFFSFFFFSISFSLLSMAGNKRSCQNELLGNEGQSRSLWEIMSAALERTGKWDITVEFQLPLKYFYHLKDRPYLH